MPGTNFENDADGYDPQDQAETFDETNLTDGGDTGEVRSFAEAADRRAFEDLPDVDAVTDADVEEDDELDYRAATAEREDDIDGLGPEDGFDEGRIARSDIDGLDEVRDASEAEGGEDDFTDLQARSLDDDDLKDLGYSEGPEGRTSARRDRT